MLPLDGRGFHVPVMFRHVFLAPRTCAHSALTAIVAHAMLREMVGHAAVIDVVKMSPADIVHGPVVVELAASPFSPDKTDAGVAESIIDAAVKTHVWAPIACMPNKYASTPAPVTRGPIHARGGDFNPRARNPIVTFVGVERPISRRPHEVRAGTNR